MADAVQTKLSHWRDWVILALAVWLFLSPWLFGFAGAMTTDLDAATAAWNAWAVAVAIAAYAVAAALWFARWEDWVNVALGAWLVVAPWVLDFGGLTAAAWNHVAVGVLIVAFAVQELRVMR
jgi:SPW repeat